MLSAANIFCFSLYLFVYTQQHNSKCDTIQTKYYCTVQRSSLLWYTVRVSVQWPCRVLCSVVCTDTTNGVQIKESLFFFSSKFEV